MPLCQLSERRWLDLLAREAAPEVRLQVRVLQEDRIDILLLLMHRRRRSTLQAVSDPDNCCFAIAYANQIPAASTVKSSQAATFVVSLSPTPM
jgi:hypothetical protein